MAANWRMRPRAIVRPSAVEQRHLQLRKRAVAADAPARGHDAVVGQARNLQTCA